MCVCVCVYVCVCEEEAGRRKDVKTSKTGVIYASQASKGQSKTDQNGVKQ